jgi:hypothetical protein
MKMTFEFYRVRGRDDAHARLGRVTREAQGLESAKEIARTLMRTLEMPQQPDGVLITDADGAELFSGSLDQEPPFMKSLVSASNAAGAVAAIDIWENEGGATGELLTDHAYGRRVEGDQT